MAPASKKGTQSKGTRHSNDRRSSSRHSTPVSALTEASPITPLPATPTLKDPDTPMVRETPYLRTSTAALISHEHSLEAQIEKSNASKPADPPTVKELKALEDQIRDTVNRFMAKRGEVSDRSMRQLVQRRKERVAEQREQEAARAAAEAARAKREQEASKKGKTATPSKKRKHEEETAVDGGEDEDKESLPTVGAHGVARQDGVGLHQGAPAPPSPPVQPGTVAADPMDTAPSPTDSDATHVDPSSLAPLYERIFGKDPTAAYDEIVYDIRDVHEDMTNEEREEVYQVAQWPEGDLHEFTAGTPPDADFSNTKPANQVNFSTFQTYVEPYIRPFTEEDVAFLKERGDRVNPYIIPQRGPKHYKDIWAAEDGLDGIAPPKQHVNNPNEARGSMEDLEDDIADQDTVSMGPTMTRLLSLLRPQATGGAKREDAEDVNGDTTMVNGDDESGAALQQTGNVDDQKPITCLPPDAPRPATLLQLDYESLEARALQEFRHIGILGPSDMPNYDAHNDDEVACRLRTLQHELRRVSRLNNIRKSRVLELTEERMAMQEYSNIADDLDNQVNTAYLKRNRSLAKPAQKKGGQHRPGQKGLASAAPAGRGVSDGVRALMQKRRDWLEMVGPVVKMGRPDIPKEDEETIFDEASLKKFEKLEREAEQGDGEGE